ncbi:4437_t:CDS:1, partial [Paraglomus brasilianum]
DKGSFSNDLLTKELQAELGSENAPENWDGCKLRVQSIIRAFRKPKRHECNITKLNNKISKLKIEKARRGLSPKKDQELVEMMNTLHDETAALAEKWHLRSKEKWIEKGEKSTKFFFSRYKARKESSCEELIKIPEEYKDKYENTLDYIKEEYQKIYKKEGWDPQMAEILMRELPQVNAEMNMNLTKSITKEEIERIIKSLPNGKSPGTDGLTYEFYKEFAEIVIPILGKVFNQVLTTGNMPVLQAFSVLCFL